MSIPNGSAPNNTADSNTRALYHLKNGIYRIEFFEWERGGGDFGKIYAAKGTLINDTDTGNWKLVGDNTTAEALHFTDKPPRLFRVSCSRSRGRATMS